MASLVFNSLIADMAAGSIDFVGDQFRVMLVGGDYVPNKDTHRRRSHVSPEVSGTGYTVGGLPTSATVSENPSTDSVQVSFSTVEWPGSSFSARACVIYRDAGSAVADQLVAYVDFGSERAVSNGTFRVSFTTPFTIQN